MGWLQESEISGETNRSCWRDWGRRDGTDSALLLSSGEKKMHVYKHLANAVKVEYDHFSRDFLEEQPLCSQLHWQQVTNSRAQRDLIPAGIYPDRSGAACKDPNIDALRTGKALHRAASVIPLSTPFLIPFQCLLESLNSIILSGLLFQI